MELEDIKNWWDDVTEGALGWIIYLALGVALAIILNAAFGFVLSTDYPVVTVESNSMEPVLYPGDIVFVRGAEKYETGDVIVFDGWKATPIIHRIVSKSERTNDDLEVETSKGFDEMTSEELKDYHKDAEDEERLYVTKGDNNPTCDQCQESGEMVLDDDIHGKMVLRVPYVGWLKLGVMRFGEAI
ncbi:MAG: signal peptidase I [Candidatus Aenigmatarchaeota archaeon]